MEGGTNGKCNMNGGKLACGEYQIKEQYWIDAGMPGKELGKLLGVQNLGT